MKRDLLIGLRVLHAFVLGYGFSKFLYALVLVLHIVPVERTTLIFASAFFALLGLALYIRTGYSIQIQTALCYGFAGSYLYEGQFSSIHPDDPMVLFLISTMALFIGLILLGAIFLLRHTPPKSIEPPQ